MRKLLKKIRDAIICIVVAPAAVIHIAYQVWYFPLIPLNNQSLKTETGYPNVTFIEDRISKLKQYGKRKPTQPPEALL